MKFIGEARSFGIGRFTSRNTIMSAISAAKRAIAIVRTFYTKILMKNNPKMKPQKERLETLASVAGRNINLSMASEMLEMEKRIERLEKVCRVLVNKLKSAENVGLES